MSERPTYKGSRGYHTVVDHEQEISRKLGLEFLPMNNRSSANAFTTISRDVPNRKDMGIVHTLRDL